MREILRWFWRVVCAVFDFGVFTPQEDTGPREAVDSIRAKLAELRAAAVRVIAGECRIERTLALERDRLAALGNEADAAPGTRLELCRERVRELESQLEEARRHSALARQRVLEFQTELDDAVERARDARVRLQIAKVRAQAEEFAMTASLDKELMAIRLSEQRANAAGAEADALAELNQALGRGGGDVNHGSQ